MPLTRRQLLARAAGVLGASLVVPHAMGATRTGSRLVVVTALGGWDVSIALDPKPGSAFVDGPELDEDPGIDDDREALTTWSALTLGTNPVKRPHVTAFFDRWADRTVLVRGLWVGSIAHEACRVRVLTGSTSERRPDLATLVGAARGRAAPIATMDLGGAGFAGELAASTGRTGRRNQLRHLLDRRVAVPGPTDSGIRHPLYRPQIDDRGAIDAWLDHRARDWAERVGGRGRGAHRVDDWFAARDRALALLAEGGDFADALGAAASSSLNAQVDLAIDLLDGGLAHTALVDSGLAWDTHDDNTLQHGLHDTLFGALDRLAAGLDDRGLLDETTVVVLSEMTRTPRRNQAGGKDHWPVTAALLFGGPLAGGRTLGATDDRLDGSPVDLGTGQPDPRGTVLRYDHLAAGLLALHDADPEAWFPGLTPLGGLCA